jgi:hypothetical protein
MTTTSPTSLDPQKAAKEPVGFESASGLERGDPRAPRIVPDNSERLTTAREELTLRFHGPSSSASGAAGR